MNIPIHRFGRAIAVLVAIVGCHRSDSSSPMQTEPLTDAVKNPPPDAAPAPLPDVEDSADRWLIVEGVKEGAHGGWATGSFDPQRNKLDIRTRDIRRFSVDASKINIDWNRLVVLSIDGKNTELRRREDPLLHFELDPRGQWVVLEP